MSAKDCDEKLVYSEEKVHLHYDEIDREDDAKNTLDEQDDSKETKSSNAEESNTISSSGKHQNNKYRRQDSDTSDQSEEDDSDLDDEPVNMAAITARLGSAKGSHRRSVVSSPLAMDRSWKPPYYKKSKQDQESIRRSVRRNILFANVSEEVLQVLVDGMKHVAVKPDKVIIEQGDAGDLFYILDCGCCEFLVNGKSVGEVNGTSDRNFFGELALLYDAPRAATVIARTPVECWALDRITFKRILMTATIKQRQLYLDFIDQVPIFSALSSYEKMTVADALRPLYFEPDNVIIEEETAGDDFYIIEDGEVKCTINGREVSDHLGSGDFFGELALIQNAKRRATVTAIRTTKCVVLDRATFKRLFGPIQDHLKKRADLYEYYMNNLTAEVH
jgi:cAMP-dependent protein kinase regulator